MKGTDMTEKEHIEAARDALRAAEKSWATAITHVKGVMQANADAGRAVMANEAFKVATSLTYELANMMQAHGSATDVLLQNWPEWVAEVVVMGPGRP